MSPSTIDPHELEDHLRSALRARAATTAARPPERFTPGPKAVRPGGPASRRRALVVGAAAVAVGILAIAAVALTRDDNDDVTTRPPTPAEEGLAVHGPSGSRWFILDLPGVRPTDARVEDRDEGGIAGPERSFQAFRTADGFAGPALWVESLPAGTELGSDEDPPGTTRTTIQGRQATVSEAGGSVTIERPGGTEEGFRITAIHMDVDDVIAVAEGLFPRESGGWNAVGLPQGLVEVPHDAEAPSDHRYAEWSYTDALDGNYELFVNPGGSLAFEDWVREHVAGASSVEPLTVDDRSGVIIQTESELVAVWRPTDTVVADFRVNGTVDDLVRDLEALRPVDEAAWRGHLPPDVRSRIPG